MTKRVKPLSDCTTTYKSRARGRVVQVRPALLGLEDAASYIAMSKDWLDKNHAPFGKGPRCIQITANGKRLFKLSDLDEWVASQSYYCEEGG
jgi:hypothetical protein